MIRSMTAFAKQTSQGALGVISWEVKTVNSRFLDMSWRLPETLRDLEPKLRELAGEYLQRGKVDTSLRFHPGDEVISELQLNEGLLAQVSANLIRMREMFPNKASVDAVGLLRWPGMLRQVETDLTEVKAEVLRLFKASLEELTQTRAREGEKLKGLMITRLDDMDKIIEAVKPQLPEILKLHRERIINRFAELKLEVDQERLAQEMVYVAQKVDVMEEVDRLETHITEMRRVLKKGGAVGRRLDFLLQEMHREANTLGAKSIHTGTTQSSLELKVLIEQIREQVQNIE
jgi:uncharacterized protein (TIGR00255 family)